MMFTAMSRRNYVLNKLNGILERNFISAFIFYSKFQLLIEFLEKCRTWTNNRDWKELFLTCFLLCYKDKTFQTLFLSKYIR